MPDACSLKDEQLTWSLTSDIALAAHRSPSTQISPRDQEECTGRACTSAAQWGPRCALMCHPLQPSSPSCNLRCVAFLRSEGVGGSGSYVRCTCLSVVVDQTCALTRANHDVRKFWFLVSASRWAVLSSFISLLAILSKVEHTVHLVLCTHEVFSLYLIL